MLVLVLVVELVNTDSVHLQGCCKVPYRPQFVFFSLLFATPRRSLFYANCSRYRAASRRGLKTLWMVSNQLGI
jgi:hypothetical protein